MKHTQTAKQIQKRIDNHKYVQRDTSPIVKCPECGKLYQSVFHSTIANLNP